MASWNFFIIVGSTRVSLIEKPCVPPFNRRSSNRLIYSKPGLGPSVLRNFETDVVLNSGKFPRDICTPPDESQCKGEYPIGHVKYLDKKLYEFALKDKFLTKEKYGALGLL